MTKTIEFEFENARNGNWSYNIFYGLDTVGNVFGNESETKILLHTAIPEKDMQYLLSQVSIDLNINTSDIKVL